MNQMIKPRKCGVCFDVEMLFPELNIHFQNMEKY